MIMDTHPDDPLNEREDVSCAPESGQPPGGPDNPWADNEAITEASWPPAHHAVPKDEL
jgi:hypothetical protein